MRTRALFVTRPLDYPRRVSRHVRQKTGEEQRATWLELFFDLVYVFAVTQLSHALLADLSITGALKTLFLLLVIWWAWNYTTWMANWFDPDAVPVRVVLLGVMLASLLMAAAVPHAFGGDGLLFAAAYVALQVGRNTFNVVVGDRGSTFDLSFRRILAWSVASAPLWLAGGVADGRGRVLLWLAALALDYAGPYALYWTPGLGRSGTADWAIEGAHFAERFQLFVIIALGESIVVTGATASDRGIDAGTTAALALCFVSSAALWWLYFDRVAVRAQARLAASGGDAGRLGRDAYTYLHLPIVAGVVLAAVGDELVIARPGHEATLWQSVAVAGGAALYLIGHLLFRYRMTQSTSLVRIAAVVLLIGLVPLGTALPLVAVGIGTAAILVALVAAEQRPSLARM